MMKRFTVTDLRAYLSAPRSELYELHAAELQPSTNIKEVICA